jgi:hypothetical protein
MVQQAGDLISLPSPSGGQPTQPFSFDVSLASPLNFLGARCRFPHIRRQAIQILKKAEKASWNCEHCALVAQYLLELEEKDLGEISHCREVPSKSRVRRIYSDIVFEEGFIKLSYVRYPYTATAPVHIAILPLIGSRDLSTHGSMEIDPIVPPPPESEVVETEEDEESTWSEPKSNSSSFKASKHPLPDASIKQEGA